MPLTAATSKASSTMVPSAKTVVFTPDLKSKVTERGSGVGRIVGSAAVLLPVARLLARACNASRSLLRRCSSEGETSGGSCAPGAIGDTTAGARAAGKAGLDRTVCGAKAPAVADVDWAIAEPWGKGADG